MRTARFLLPGLALLAGTLGCCAFQKTAGICDCNPPAVESLLQPPPRPTPMSVIRHAPVHQHAPQHHHAHPAPANPIAAPPSHPAPTNPPVQPNAHPAPIEGQSAPNTGSQPLSVLPPVRIPSPPSGGVPNMLKVE